MPLSPLTGWRCDGSHLQDTDVRDGCLLGRLAYENRSTRHT